MQIIVNQISKSYGTQNVLQDVSLSAGDGELIGITGRNGCGKSTLLSILAGVEPPDRGTITFSEPGGRRLVGYLPQINPLIETASVEDNLKLWTEDREGFHRLAQEYNLTTILKKKVATLSGGMKRRLAIACALALNPRLLIMDEPTSALDIEYKKQIHEQMSMFTAQGGTIIMVTHEAEEIQLCTRCYQLEDGRLNLYGGH